jgi:DNA-binding NtrC family response regulator
MKKTRILVAHELNRSEVIISALMGYELVLVSDITAAEYQVMEDGIDMFIVGIHFDDSRAIELVNFIRLNKKHKTTPVIMVRLLSSAIADFLRSTTETFIKIGSISHYLELVDEPEPGKVILDAVTAAFAIQKTGAER